MPFTGYYQTTLSESPFPAPANLQSVYFIPAHPNATTALAAVTERLRTAYPDEDLAPMGRWTLEQKLMRDTPSLLPASANPSAGKPRYMQFMHLSHAPKTGFLYTSEPPEKPFHPPHANPASASPTPMPSFQGNLSSQTTSTPPLSQSTSLSNSFAADVPPMIMTILPLPSFNMLFQHFLYACQPFWAHRLTVAVPQGIIYDIGDFRVRVGDVRQTFPTSRPRGTLVEIEWRGPTVLDTVAASYSVPKDGDSDSGIEVDFSVIEEADVDAEFEATAVLIKDFWGRLGIEGAREAILVPGFGKEVKERFVKWQARKADGKEPVVDEDLHVNADLARQYMEVLRLNR